MILELLSVAIGLGGVAFGLYSRRALKNAKVVAATAPPAEVSEQHAAALLPNAVAARFGQDGVLWTIIGSFWATNAVLLVALGATGKWAESVTLVRVICSTGLFVSFVWLVMQAAALRRVIYYEALTTKLEAALGVAEDVRMFGRQPEASTRGGPLLPEARKVMPLGPVVALLGWAVGTYLAFVL